MTKRAFRNRKARTQNIKVKIQNMCVKTQKITVKTHNKQETGVNKSWVSRLRVEGTGVWGQENRLYLSWYEKKLYYNCCLSCGFRDMFMQTDWTLLQIMVWVTYAENNPNLLNQNSKVQTQKHKTQTSKHRSHKPQTQNSKGPYTKHNVTYRLP